MCVITFKDLYLFTTLSIFVLSQIGPTRSAFILIIGFLPAQMVLLIVLIRHLLFTVRLLLLVQFRLKGMTYPLTSTVVRSILSATVVMML